MLLKLQSSTQCTVYSSSCTACYCCVVLAVLDSITKSVTASRGVATVYKQNERYENESVARNSGVCVLSQGYVAAVSIGSIMA
jgi:hypothetical protein